MAFKSGTFKIIKLFHINRFYSVKRSVKLNEDVSKNIESAVFKPRHHPGRLKIQTVTVPEKIVNAITNVSADYPLKNLITDSKKLARHLQNRLLPIEENELQQIKKNIMSSVLEKENVEQKTDAELERFYQSVKYKVQSKLHSVVYNWAPIDFDMYNSLLYLYARFAPEYAVLLKIFYEITLRDSTFRPKSFFDFGSGVGTATWAANVYWKNSIFEYFNVDSSKNMNDIAVLLHQDGRENADPNLKGTFYRQFLPSNNMSYDIVVCAYSLFELPSLRSRLQTVLNLWNKTGKYLVIVEYGTNPGFKIINQVRDYLLNIGKDKNLGHVFSPCPHDMICPMYLVDTTPCSFSVSYMTPPFSGALVPNKEKYSYVVLRKGKKEEDDPQWPRIIQEPLIRSKHTICRMCTKHGKLDEEIFTSYKHGKVTYHCARSSERGDILPVEIEQS